MDLKQAISKILSEFKKSKKFTTKYENALPQIMALIKNHDDKLQSKLDKALEALKDVRVMAEEMDCNADRDCRDYAIAGLIINRAGNTVKRIEGEL